MRLNRFGFGVLAMMASGLAVSACEVYVVDPPRHATAVYRPPPPPPRAAPPPVVRTVRVRRVAIGAATPGVATSATLAAAPATPTTTATTPSCLDPGTATMNDCASLRASDASCTTSPKLAQKCAAYKTYFDPKVAAAAISCIAQLTGPSVCDVSQPSACVRKALAQACPDAALVQVCQVAATSCKTTTGDCTALLSGLNDQGQQEVAQCVAQGCGAGLYACIETLGSVSATSSAIR